MAAKKRKKRKSTTKRKTRRAAPKKRRKTAKRRAKRTTSKRRSKKTSSKGTVVGHVARSPGMFYFVDGAGNVRKTKPRRGAKRGHRTCK